MKALIKGVFKGIEETSPRQRRLEEILKSGDNFELVADSDRYPEHLIAHGRVIHGERTFEIRTAISVTLGRRREDDDVEFSTNVGQIPDTPLGSEVVERLNHRLVGKVVTFDSGQPGLADAVYATRKPAGWLNDRSIRDELEDHAETTVIVRPILEQTLSYGQLNPDSTDQDIKGIARDFVDNFLDLNYGLRGKFSPPAYLPERTHSDEEQGSS